MSDTTSIEQRLGTTDQILGEQAFLRRLAVRLLHRRDGADDLVQETLLRAYEARRRFRTGTSMRAWLATILRRLFLSSAYKNRRRKTQSDSDLGEPLETLSETGEIAPITGPVNVRYDRLLEQVDDDMRRACDRLSETYRTPFLLFALDGLSYAEIAGRLSIPVGTVMSRIHRARTQIKNETRRLPPSARAG